MHQDSRFGPLAGTSVATVHENNKQLLGFDASLSEKLALRRPVPVKGSQFVNTVGPSVANVDENNKLRVFKWPNDARSR